MEKEWKFDSKSFALGIVLGLFLALLALSFGSAGLEGKKQIKVGSERINIEWFEHKFHSNTYYKFSIISKSDTTIIHDKKGNLSFNDYVIFSFDGHLAEVKRLNDKFFVKYKKQKLYLSEHIDTIIREEIIIEAKKIFKKYSAYKSYVE